MTKPLVYWTAPVPTRCDITAQPIKDLFIDGRTTSGPWAIMTPASHKRYGVGLGLGRGQMYRRQSDGRWLKVEG